jgi:hypothetical protein
MREHPQHTGYARAESLPALSFTGQSSIEAARSARDEARTAAELRIALAVLLPLKAGLSLAQTALVLGRSRHTTCALRTDPSGSLPDG